MRKRLAGWSGWPLKRKSAKRSPDDTDPGIITDTVPVVAAPIPVIGASWAAGASDRGRARANNEDGFLCAPERGLFIICDGMGGHSAGEIASSRAIRFLDGLLAAEVLEQAFGADRGIEGWLRQILQQVNDEVLALGQENEVWESMATTVVIGAIHERGLHVANLGDSRAYLIRGGEARVLTKDHSVAAALAEQGQLESDRARAHPLRNQLTASLGLRQPVAPFYHTEALQSDDRIVFCSDGLWDMLPDREIARITMSQSDPAEAARALIRAANEVGGADNITVIVLMMQAEGSPLLAADAAAEIGQGGALDEPLGGPPGEPERDADALSGRGADEARPDGGAAR